MANYIELLQTMDLTEAESPSSSRLCGRLLEASIASETISTFLIRTPCTTTGSHAVYEDS